MTELIEKRKSKTGAGRPFIDEELRLKVGTVRLSPTQWEQFYSLGGAVWLREAIKRATARRSTKD